MSIANTSFEGYAVMDFLKYFIKFNFIYLLYGAFLLVFTYIFYCIKFSKEKNNDLQSYFSSLKGPKTIPFFGNSLNFILRPADIAQTLMFYSKKYGSRYRLRIGQKAVIVITNPTDTEKALIGNKFLNKGADFHEIFGRVFKNGTFTAEGSDWKKSRTILQRPLRTNVLDNYIQIMNEEAISVVKNLQMMENTAESFNVLEDYIAPATFNIVCRTLFDLKEPISKKDHCIFREKSAEYLMDSFYLMFQPKFVRKIGQIVKKKRREDIFSKMELVYRKITHENESSDRQNANKNKTDEVNEKFIEYLTDEAFSSEDRKGEIITYSVGGSETLSITISFFLLMLGMYPNIQDKVHEELDYIFGNCSDGNVTIDDIKRMNYLEQVLKEVLRMFPVVPFVFRTAVEDTILGDLKIAAGTELIFNLTGLHYDSQYFPSPETFDPDRFSEERSKNLPKGCFLPFATGPRNCIGKAFSLYEMKIICSSILRKYRIHTTMKQENVRIQYFFVITNANGFYISISARNQQLST